MSRPRIVVGDRAFNDTIRYLRKFGKLATADAWLTFMTGFADDRLLARRSPLRMVSGVLKGCDNFDVAAAPRRHPATLSTPHLGSAVTDVRPAIERRATDNIVDAPSGRVPRDVVNPAARKPDHG